MGNKTHVLGGAFDDKEASELFKKVVSNQGATLKKVSELAAVSKEDAQNHLDSLEMDGLISTSTVGGRLRYFTSDYLEAAVEVVDGNQARILQNLPEKDFLLLGELRGKTSLDPWVLESGLDELCVKGLVERRDMRHQQEGYKLRFRKEYYSRNVVTLTE